MNRKFEIGDRIICNNIDPLPGNKIAPPLELKKDYAIIGETFDKEGNQHLDVGLTSTVAFVTSYETKEDLPDGDKIWWCHPSRFEKA